MSAIVAVCRTGGAPAEVAVVEAILARMSHRSPDGHASWTQGSTALGHGLFATTPEDAHAEQPLQSPTSTCRVVADVRLDNREELARELGLEASETARACDAELVVRAYDRWGDGCARHLLGDFAFAVWDPHRQRLFCARDPFGVRSLFWFLDDKGLRCASETSALFADPGIPRAPHLPSLALYLSEDYLEREETLYSGIRALPPGHALSTDGRRVRIEAHWRPDPWKQVRHATDDEYAEDFRSVFREAVRCRMRSQLPVSAQLSGGFDSSSVVGTLETLRREGCGPRTPATLVHSSFPGLACHEEEFSRAVAEHWGLTMTTLLPPEDPALTRPHPSSVSRDVHYHPLAVLWNQQFELTRQQGRRVTFTGMGGDQVMSRSGHECAEALVSGSIRDAARSVGLDERPLSPRSWKRLVGQGVLPLLPPGVQRAVRRVRGRSDGVPPSLTPQMRRLVAERRWSDTLRRRSLPAPGPASRAFCDSLTHGYEVILALSSLALQSAKNRVELRHPFYDVRLVELLLSFPHAQRCGYHEAKPVLKRAMNGWLPELVRTRTRPAEFTPFVHRVLNETHGAEVRALFEGSRLEQAGVVDGAKVRDLLSLAQRDWSLMRQVGNLTALELWLRQINT